MRFLLWYKGKRLRREMRDRFGPSEDRFLKDIDKKRPNTIPVFGPGKWLLGESRALKVGINAG
ncbi:hypothetical protein [Raoultella scottii]|uniref:hypothetical protein n=1 Tax=Raoultella scottii TaxID=3040937 RepID=UPI002FA25C8A